MDSTGDAFDRFVQAADGLPGVTKTRPSTVRSTHPLTGVTATHIVQTYREAEAGFTVLVERVDAGGHYRLVLPPEVAAAVYRQRMTLVDRSTPESRHRKAAATARKKLRAERLAHRLARTT